VDQAANALAAICALIRHTPDLVLADIRMPIIDGAELARELKRHRDSCHIPVVALTGYDTPGCASRRFNRAMTITSLSPLTPASSLLESPKFSTGTH
jgi:CheY-like chemotaxis protein